MLFTCINFIIVLCAGRMTQQTNVVSAFCCLLSKLVNASDLHNIYISNQMGRNVFNSRFLIPLLFGDR